MNLPTTPQIAEIPDVKTHVLRDDDAGTWMSVVSELDYRGVVTQNLAAIARLSEELQQARADLCVATMEAESLPAQSAFDQVKAQLSAALAEVERMRGALVESATALAQMHRARSRGDDRAEQQAAKGEITDPGVLSMLKQSLQEAKDGKLVSLGSFAQYAIRDDNVQRCWKKLTAHYGDGEPLDHDDMRAALEEFVRGQE